mmetsp:Transcript_30495/g.51050  ORF Transcript_30495/g.51050 Transcript_30495/m.51050 type:complete len:892 (+) Transcript_30495:133-2808(+)
MNVKRKLPEDIVGEKRKGRKKGFVWSHVVTDQDGRVSCIHCGELIKVNFGEKVERLRKHFIKNCTKCPFQKDSKEYEELLECVSSPPIEQKKKAFAGKAKNSSKIICYHIDFVSSVLAGNYSVLTPDQIFLLEAQGNRSSNWGGVKLLCPAGVSFDSSLEKIRGCYFSGNIFIGLFVKTTMMQGGISVMSGLYNSNFSGNCVLSDNCYVWNTAMVVNTYVGRNSCIVGCGNVLGEGHTSYGTLRTITVGPQRPAVNAAAVAPLNPTPPNRRDVLLNVRASYEDVCGSVFLRQVRGGDANDDGDKDPAEMVGSSSSAAAVLAGGAPLAVSTGVAVQQQQQKPKRAKYNRNDSFIRFDMTIICDDVELMNCCTVRNAFIGNYCKIKDAMINSSAALSHCEIASAQLVEAVLHQSCKVMSGAQLNGVLMFPHSSVSSNAKVGDSVLGPDSSVSIGECKNSLLGPLTGFHHQSLLISSAWAMGRGNIGYGGMIGANHTGRKDDQECFPGEGFFFGLGASVKFPFNSIQSPYSIVAANTSCVAQKVCFPFSLISAPQVPLPTEAPFQSSMSALKPAWVLTSNPYFIERSMNKFARRRRSDYRTDLPIFRPTIAEMVTDARNRLLKFKETHLQQSHGRATNVSALQLTEVQVAGAGKCVISGADIDAAIDAYTQFLHRYSLHGLLYMTAMAGELPPNSLLPGAGADEIPVEELDAVLSDVRSMTLGLPSMGDHLHQLAVGSGAPPASSSAKASASVYSGAEPAAREIPSKGASLLLGTGGSAGCCLLSDTHNPTVRAHQLKVLSDEFPDVDAHAYFQSPLSPTPNATKVKQLLKYLCELEQQYVERVKVSKQKDVTAAMAIIPDFTPATEVVEQDETVLSARSRAVEIIRCVHILTA